MTCFDSTLQAPLRPCCRLMPVAQCNLVQEISQCLAYAAIESSEWANSPGKVGFRSVFRPSEHHLHHCIAWVPRRKRGQGRDLIQ